jgi:hypothetical protein
MTSAIWFLDRGIGVFPLKARSKEPACESWDDYTCTREQASRFVNYGVRLTANFGVVDSDSPESEAWVAAHVPITPFMVTTGRGRHRYFRLLGDTPKFIHRNGHTIEVRNAGQYVVGPGSIHPGGAIYTADDWSWNINDVPVFPADFVFDDRPPETRGSANGAPLVLPEVVCESERHETLHKIMRSLAARGVPLEGALAACHLENRSRCRPPLTDLHELDSFLRRAYWQKDRADFVRTPQTGWALSGALLEVGLSVDAALIAVRSIDPAFDPETSE